MQESRGLDALARMGGFGLLIAWYYGIGKSQQGFMLGHFVRKTVLVQMHAGDDTVSREAPPHPNERLVLRGWNHRANRAQANMVKS